MDKLVEQQDDLKPVVEEIRQQLCEIHLRWKFFRQLFASGIDNARLLDSAAPTFFRVLRDAMMESIVLRLSKLLDTNGTGTEKNLTLRYLREQLGLPEDFFPKKVRLLELRTKIRDIRNRFVAHHDLGLLDPSDPTLDSVTYDELHECIELTTEFLKMLDHEYGSEDVMYDTVLYHGDGDVILRLLRGKPNG